MVISLSHGVLIGPHVLLGLPFAHCFAILGCMCAFIVIVGEPKPMVIEGPLLDNNQHLGVVEGFNAHLGHIFEQIMMIDGANFLSLEVNNVDVVIGNVHNNDLPVTDHPKRVDDIIVLVFKQNFTSLIHMNDALSLSRLDHLGENEGFVKGCRKTEDLLRLLLKL